MGAGLVDEGFGGDGGGFGEGFEFFCENLGGLGSLGGGGFQLRIHGTLKCNGSMDEYRDSYRVTPLWAVLVLTIPVGLGAWAIAAAGYVDSLAGTPLFAMFAYGLAVGYLNRVGVRVTAAGVEKWFGPLGAGVAPHYVDREEIAKVYVRYVYKTAKSGQAPYWAAGVERTDGVWVDLTNPLATTEAVRGAAVEIARALEWQEPIAVLRGNPAKWERKEMVTPYLLWGGAATAALVWGVYVELTMRG